MFAQAHGMGSIPNLLLSGEPTPLYHYASYAMPGGISALMNATAFDVLTSFQLPFGILLSGLAAYILGGGIWGKWPGVAATVAVILIPDAYEQGFGNKFLSYQFHLQSAVTSGYGLCCVAVAWAFILNGCRNGKKAFIVMGYAFAALSIAYKAHLFVANAFLILIYPALFFEGLRLRSRLLVAVLLSIVFAYVLTISQHVHGLPTLRLDASYARGYSDVLLYSYDPGTWKQFVRTALGGREGWDLAPRMGVMILLSTFGGWLAAASAAGFCLRGRCRPVVLLFPLFVVMNYGLMAVGLAADASGKWNPEEMLNRPLIWAFFAVAAWTGAGLYVLGIGEGVPKGWRARGVAVGCTLGCMGWPLAFGPRLETMPAWNGLGDRKVFNSAPTALVTACRYIRANSGKGDIVQDSEGDPTLMVTGLTEREAFVATPGKDGEGARRKAELVRWDFMKDERGIAAYAVRSGVGWYVLRPQTKVEWPDALLKKAVFDTEGYRVFCFGKREEGGF